MKKILINGLQLAKQFSGVQYYLEYLLRAIEQLPIAGIEIALLLPKHHKSKIGTGSTIKLHQVNMNSNNRLLRIGYEHLLISKLIKKEKYDLLHSPSYLLPMQCLTKNIITVHDTIALDYPELCSSFNAKYFKYFLPGSVRQADHIIAVSKQVKNDIIRHFNIQGKKIHVIHNGISPHFVPVSDTSVKHLVRKKYKLPKAYMLFVGNIEPKKNLDFLIRSYESLIERHRLLHHLVIVGQLAWKFKGTIRLIEQSSYRNRIHLLGYVNECDLPSIYTLASIFVFPSLYEGFGYPVLEAMACGTPVICSNRGALPETTGENCLLVNPTKKEEWIAAMFKLTTDEYLRQDLIRKGLKWSQDFSIHNCTKKTLATYQLLSKS